MQEQLSRFELAKRVNMLIDKIGADTLETLLNVGADDFMPKLDRQLNVWENEFWTSDDGGGQLNTSEEFEGFFSINARLHGAVGRSAKATSFDIELLENLLDAPDWIVVHERGGSFDRADGEYFLVPGFDNEENNRRVPFSTLFTVPSSKTPGNLVMLDRKTKEHIYTLAAVINYPTKPNNRLDFDRFFGDESRMAEWSGWIEESLIDSFMKAMEKA